MDPNVLNVLFKCNKSPKGKFIYLFLIPMLCCMSLKIPLVFIFQVRSFFMFGLAAEIPTHHSVRSLLSLPCKTFLMLYITSITIEVNPGLPIYHAKSFSGLPCEGRQTWPLKFTNMAFNPEYPGLSPALAKVNFLSVCIVFCLKLSVIFAMNKTF